MTKNRKIVAFKKRNVAGECRALRCKEAAGLQEFDRPDQPTVLLCAAHLARAVEHNPAGEAPAQPTGALPDLPVPMVGIDEATGNPIHSLDGGATWAFGDPPEEPEPPADLVLPPEVLHQVEAGTGRPIVSHDGGDSWAYVEEAEASVQAASNLEPPPLSEKVTAVVVDHDDVSALVIPLANEWQGMAPQLVGFVVNDQATVDTVGELLLQVKGKLSELQKGRKRIVQPLIDAKRAVDDLFRPATDAAKTIEGLLKDALGAFTDRQQAAQVAALQAGQHAAALAVEQPTMPQGVSQVTVWKWRITDVRLIPADYLVVDSAKVQARVNLMKGACDIPGVEAYPETGVRAATS